MDKAAQLAGFFVSHAIWTVSQEVGVLMPVAGFDPPEGRRTMVQFDNERRDSLIETAKTWLEENPDGAVRAVLILDGVVLLPSGKTDALIIEVRKYGSSPGSLSMAVPYRPLSAPGGFGVYRPRYLEYSGSQGESLTDDSSALDEAFWRGVASHDDGAAAWRKIEDAC
jgi:hypothetical protein